jgi:hypothetical protein
LARNRSLTETITEQRTLLLNVSPCSAMPSVTAPASRGTDGARVIRAPDIRR